MSTSAISAPPAPDELEVSVFGPGVGEGILVHLGGGDWIVVDSCVDRTVMPGEPAALGYLQSLRVDPAQAIRLVVVTHWHDDHIGGIGRVFEKASSAKLACSAALTSSEFLTLMRLAKS